VSTIGLTSGVIPTAPAQWLSTSDPSKAGRISGSSLGIRARKSASASTPVLVRSGSSTNPPAESSTRRLPLCIGRNVSPRSMWPIGNASPIVQPGSSTANWYLNGRTGSDTPHGSRNRCVIHPAAQITSGARTR
jgi:hypothetical protein